MNAEILVQQADTEMMPVYLVVFVYQIVLHAARVLQKLPLEI
jgi:hypothetical protein